MRHKVAGKKLNKAPDHRKAMRRTLIKQLFTHERIRTTRAKAEAIRGEAEKLITLARNSSASEKDIDKVNARRLAAAKLGGGADVVKKLFDDIGPRFEGRNGGYTRMFKLEPRLGDAAEMVLLELVED
ncbi:MAG: 50S ribosomal protein L17 [Anaerolineaceae bacterium]|nr:50S ribosomal protein L17 [Anaerolineaceae bacterium]